MPALNWRKETKETLINSYMLIIKLYLIKAWRIANKNRVNNKQISAAFSQSCLFSPNILQCSSCILVVDYLEAEAVPVAARSLESYFVLNGGIG